MNASTKIMRNSMTIAATVLSCVLSASMSNGPGGPASQTVKAGDFDESVRILVGSTTGGHSSGSGALVGYKKVPRKGGGSTFKMVFVTAEHVLKGSGDFKIGFEGPKGARFQFQPESIKVGHGLKVDKTTAVEEDLAVLYVSGNKAMDEKDKTVRVVSAEQEAYLDALKPLTPKTGGTVGTLVQSNGYGVTGEDYTNPANHLSGFLYVAGKAGTDYGVHRYFTAMIKFNVPKFEQGDAPGAPPTFIYPAMKWEIGPEPGFGAACFGDSGGPIRDKKTDDYIGINTYVHFWELPAGLMMYYGNIQVGLQFTANEVKWIGMEKDLFLKDNGV